MMERSLTANWPETLNPLRLAGWLTLQTIQWCGGLGSLLA
ncbi:MAG: hypothetical protein RJA81_2282, partial [Planctomycetota bacterium]